MLEFIRITIEDNDKWFNPIEIGGVGGHFVELLIPLIAQTIY